MFVNVSFAEAPDNVNALVLPHNDGQFSLVCSLGLAGDAKLGALPAQSSELSSATTTDFLTTIDTADLFGDYLVDNTDNVINANKTSLPPSVDFSQEGNCGEVDLLSSINNIKSEHDRMTAEGDDNVFYPDNAVIGFDNDDSLLGAIGNSDFLEQFTDLSSYSNVSPESISRYFSKCDSCAGRRYCQD